MWLVLFESTLCQLMEQVRPKTGNPLESFVGFYLFLLLLCLPNFSKKSYHETGENHLYSQQKGGLVSVDRENVGSSHGAATA